MNTMNPQTIARRGRVLRAFSLLEMMVVVAILGVVAAMAVPDLMPLVHDTAMRSAGNDVASFMERARREAVAHGRCVRVRSTAAGLVLERRTVMDCDNGLGGSWSAPIATLPPARTSMVYTVQNTPGSSLLIFRPNGRVRGNGNIAIDDDGARVIISYPQVAPRVVEVRATSNGRICLFRLNAAPPLPVPTPVVCGTGFGVTPPSGGGCAAVDGAPTAPMVAALLSLFALQRRRRRPRPPAGNTPRRGYIMIEALMGGAVFAVTVAVAFVLLANAQRATSDAARKSTATALAVARAEELAASPHLTTSQALTADADDPRFQVRWDVTPSGLETQSIPPLSGPDALHHIEVEVTYTTRTGSKSVVINRLRRQVTP